MSGYFKTALLMAAMTGLFMAVGGLIGVFDRILRDPTGGVRYHYVLVDYWGWSASGEPAAGSDTAEVALASLHEIANYGINGELERTIRTAAEMHRRRREREKG